MQRPCHTFFVSHLVILTQRVLALPFKFGYLGFYGEYTLPFLMATQIEDVNDNNHVIKKSSGFTSLIHPCLLAGQTVSTQYNSKYTVKVQ